MGIEMVDRKGTDFSFLDMLEGNVDNGIVIDGTDFLSSLVSNQINNENKRDAKQDEIMNVLSNIFSGIKSEDDIFNMIDSLENNYKKKSLKKSGFDIEEKMKHGIKVNVNNEKCEILTEGILEEDLKLNDALIIEKGTSFKNTIQLGDGRYLVEFGEHTVVYDGIKIKNPSITLRVSSEIYEKIAIKKITYLKSLKDLSCKDIISEEVTVKNVGISVISREELVKSLMTEYNLYSVEDVTVKDVVDNDLRIDYRLLDRAMEKLGFTIFGEDFSSKIYIK